MSITPQNTASNAPTEWHKHALEVWQAGFNAIPLHTGTKIPALESWKRYTVHRQTEEELLALPWSAETANIAIVNGINGIRTIDIDESDDADTLFHLIELLGLDFEYPWIVHTPGRGGGIHIHFQCNEGLTLTSKGVLTGDPLPGQPFKQIELRWSNCLTVFPPSIHPDVPADAQDYERRYDWLFHSVPQPLAVIPVRVVEAAFNQVATIQKAKPQEAPAPPPDDQAAAIEDERPTVHYDAWSQKALDQEISLLHSAPEGQRNSQLNRAAFALGQIIGAKLLDRPTVEEELYRTALACRLNEKEILPTIKSGIDAGTRKPRLPKQVYKTREPAFKLPPMRKIDDKTLADFSADDQGHAEAVHWLYGKYLAHNDAYGWMIWNGTHFTPSVHRINTLIVEVLRHRQRAAAHMEKGDLAKISKAFAGAVNATRAMLENLCHVDVNDFDAEPDLINCLSGIINLRTKEVMPHDPIYRFTWCSPVKYNHNAEGTLWLDFLNQTVTDPITVIPYMQQSLGYSITGHTDEECLYYIYGPTRSGKGTACETILAIFPRPIASEVDFNTFTAKREADTQNFDLAPLKPARIVFASESNKYQSLNPAKVKALTGGNLVSCAFKHKDTFSYRPLYTVWLSSNHELNADAEDSALWGRVRIVPFPNSRLGKEDTSLKRQMQSAANLEFVLCWLVEGAYQWYKLNDQGRKLQAPEAVRQITDRQRNAQDTVGIWLDDQCEIDPTYWTDTASLRANYEAWCKANGYTPKGGNSFTDSLQAHGLEVTKAKRIQTGPDQKSTRSRGYQGVRIANTDPF
jgi:putative DNA primase/helicase